MITRRCTQRQFLMRPDEETNNAFIYCLAVAAQRYGIRVIFTTAMSNHHHTGIEDPNGNYPAFLEHFHKLFAKCQNALRGRWENFWSTTCVHSPTGPVFEEERGHLHPLGRTLCAAVSPRSATLVGRCGGRCGVVLRATLVGRCTGGAPTYDSDERGIDGLRTLFVERRAGTACSPKRTTRSKTCSWALRLGSSPSTVSHL